MWPICLLQRCPASTWAKASTTLDSIRSFWRFLALPVLWNGTLIQYTGRLHRLHSAKNEVRIFDYVDRDTPMLLSMFEKRLHGCRGTNYSKRDAPLGSPEPGDEIVVENDEDVLHSLKEADDFA